VARAVVSWLLVVGIAELGSARVFIKTGPDWRREVALWRLDHAHEIAIWPSGWTMTLKSE
jgi:hypothetical protein